MERGAAPANGRRSRRMLPGHLAGAPWRPTCARAPAACSQCSSLPLSARPCWPGDSGGASRNRFDCRLPWPGTPAGIQSRHRANRQQRSGDDDGC
jgi:hypothetical protein